MIEFGTKIGWQEWADLRGDPSPTTIDPATGEAFTALLSDQAFQRGRDYINQTYWNFVKPEFHADDISGIRADVLDAFVTATYLASSHELETPRIYSVTIDPQRDQEIKKVGSLEFFASRTNASSIQRVINERPVNDNIHRLLDRFVRIDVTDPTPQDPFYIGTFNPGCL